MGPETQGLVGFVCETRVRSTIRRQVTVSNAVLFLGEDEQPLMASTNEGSSSLPRRVTIATSNYGQARFKQPV